MAEKFFHKTSEIRSAVNDAYESLKLKWLTEECFLGTEIPIEPTTWVDKLPYGAIGLYDVSNEKVYYSLIDGRLGVENSLKFETAATRVVVNEQAFEFADIGTFTSNMAKLMKEYALYFKQNPASIWVITSERSEDKYGFLIESE